MWDPVTGAYGLDSAGFDNAGFDPDPKHEFTKIMDCFRDNILSQADYNKIWFAGIYDAVKELPNSEWIKKSTYIVPKLKKQVNTTGRIGYDAVNILEQYIDKKVDTNEEWFKNESMFLNWAFYEYFGDDKYLLEAKNQLDLVLDNTPLANVKSFI